MRKVTTIQRSSAHRVAAWCEGHGIRAVFVTHYQQDSSSLRLKTIREGSQVEVWVTSEEHLQQVKMFLDDSKRDNIFPPWMFFLSSRIPFPRRGLLSVKSWLRSVCQATFVRAKQHFLSSWGRLHNRYPAFLSHGVLFLCSFLFCAQLIQKGEFLHNTQHSTYWFMTRIGGWCNYQELTHPDHGLSILTRQILRGHLWRLVTPSLMHHDFSHLFYNLLFFFVLGKQLERRTTAKQYVFLILLFSSIPNTVQYFLGHSWVFCGLSGVNFSMMGWTFAKMHYAPWEGYSIPRPILILGLASLGLEYAGGVMSFFSPGVADVLHRLSPFSLPFPSLWIKHTSGLFLGYFCGSWGKMSAYIRMKKRLTHPL